MGRTGEGKKESGRTGEEKRGRDSTLSDSSSWRLVRETEGLALVGNGMTLRGDFTRMLPRVRAGNLGKELLVRASRLKDTGEVLTAVDATAGLGEDSFLLAAAGWTVWMCEFDPVMAALLEDALQRAREVPELCNIAERMHLLRGDSRELLGELPFRPGLVFLDPMFPGRQKSGLVKKKAQLLQLLEKPCDDEEGLLFAAAGAGPKKIVVKRPLKGPFLAGKKPDYSLQGKAIRYDCYTRQGIFS